MIRDAKVLEAYLRDLLNSLPDASFLVNSSGNFVLANGLIEQMFGYGREELHGKPIGTLIPERFKRLHEVHSAAYFARPRARPMGIGLSLRALHKKGTEIPVEISLSPIETDRGTYVLGAIRDVSQSDERYREGFEHLGVGAVHSDLDGQFLNANRKFGEISGYARNELLGLNIRDVTHPDYIASSIEARREMLKGVRSWYERELRLTRKDGTEIWVHITTSLARGAEGQPAHFISLIRDISRQKELENDQSQMALRFQQVTENIHEVFWLIDAVTQEILYVSPAYEGIWRRSVRRLYSASGDWLESIHPEDRARVLAASQTKQLTGDYDEEYRIVRPDGTTRWIRDRAFPVHGEAGKVVRIAGVAEDITERKRVEDQLHESERRFRSMLQNVDLVSLMLDREARVTYCNDYLLRLTGWTREEAIGVNWIENFLPMETHEGLERIHAALLADLPTAWHYENEIVTRSGERRLVRWNNTVLRSYSGEVVGTASIGEDITKLRRAEEENQRSIVQLKAVLMGTVDVATTLSEMRDPYTAGHEQRVARIAVAIGAELHLDAHRQEGLQVAGRLHDIGKITIPVEILTKPAKLTAIEYQLVQGHARAGYEVLKNIAFPWPVAEVALQHHERIDGSGYPQGLRDEAILLEARIMAVADVVEAMSSHRPYRPGLGIEKALAEIERGSGTIYDSNVANACLRLFREKRFHLPT